MISSVLVRQGGFMRCGTCNGKFLLPSSQIQRRELRYKHEPIKKRPPPLPERRVKGIEKKPKAAYKPKKDENENESIQVNTLAFLKRKEKWEDPAYVASLASAYETLKGWRPIFNYHLDHYDGETEESDYEEKDAKYREYLKRKKEKKALVSVKDQQLAIIRGGGIAPERKEHWNKKGYCPRKLNGDPNTKILSKQTKKKDMEELYKEVEKEDRKAGRGKPSYLKDCKRVEGSQSIKYAALNDVQSWMVIYLNNKEPITSPYAKTWKDEKVRKMWLDSVDNRHHGRKCKIQEMVEMALKRSGLPQAQLGAGGGNDKKSTILL